MDFIEKCKVAGIGDGSVYEGYPVVDENVFKKVDGVLKAFTKREDPKSWESILIEDKDFSATTLKKIADIEAGKTANLTAGEIAAIEAAEAAEDEAANAPTLVELDKRLKVVEAAISK